MNVVITGSTRGLGFGLAWEFLWRGHAVTVTGRSEASTALALASLRQAYPDRQLFAQACDVRDAAQLEALWLASKAHFGQVDLSINNAGLTTPSQNLWTLPKDKIDEVIHTNLLGAIHGSAVAVRGMLEQGHGQLYNMEGLGSDGRVFAGSGVYSATKAALTTLTKGLIKETRETPVRVGFLSPGIVVTDLVTGDVENLLRNRRVLNVLADQVGAVAPFLVERMLRQPKHGARITWLSPQKVAVRLLKLPFSRRDPFLPPA